MAERVSKPGEIKVGAFFEDCRLQPCVCARVDDTGVHIEGIALTNGGLLSCNIRHCSLRKLTPAEAVQWRLEGPPDVHIPPESRWWGVR
jgi:hypothetical protein